MRDISQTVQSSRKFNLRHRVTPAVAAVCSLFGAGAFAANAVGAKSTVTNKVQVVDDAVHPGHVKIKVGQKVQWVWSNANFDAHNVTLKSGPSGVSTSAFTSKTKVKHYSFSRKFTVPGKYKFICTIHPWMQTTVVVKK